MKFHLLIRDGVVLMVPFLKEAMRLTRDLFYIPSLLCALLLSWPLVTSADQAQYFYDELGRLIGVVSGQGNIASYEYDAVGNLLSISTSSVTTPTITNVSPDPVLAGTTIPITISGTGLLLSSVTTSNPDIQVGIITTNTDTTIETTLDIPNPTIFGATTLTVNGPGGSASTTLTVNQPALIITQLNPDSGNTGDPIVIDGQGFGMIPGGNQVTFAGSGNTRQVATVVEQSLTRLEVRVPRGVVTGPITVEVAGQMSNAEIFTALDGLTDIVATGTNGTPADPNLPSANLGQVITVQGIGLAPGDQIEFSTLIPSVLSTFLPRTTTVGIFGISVDGTSAQVTVPLPRIAIGAETVITAPIRLKRGTATLGSVILQIIPTLFAIQGGPLMPGGTATLDSK